MHLSASTLCFSSPLCEHQCNVSCPIYIRKVFSEISYVAVFCLLQVIPLCLTKSCMFCTLLLFNMGSSAKRYCWQSSFDANLPWEMWLLKCLITAFISSMAFSGLPFFLGHILVAVSTCPFSIRRNTAFNYIQMLSPMCLIYNPTIEVTDISKYITQKDESERKWRPAKM